MSSLVHMNVSGITFIMFAQNWKILVHQFRSKLKDIESQKLLNKKVKAPKQDSQNRPMSPMPGW